MSGTNCGGPHFTTARGGATILSAPKAIATAITGQLIGVETAADHRSGRIVARLLGSPGRARQANGSAAVIVSCFA